MLMTVTVDTSAMAPARDAREVGYVWHKHPERAQRFELSFGAARVVYPEASAERCAVALVLEVDPIGLSRGRKAAAGMPLLPYVNDRPYVASSMLSVAISQVFGTALAGRCASRPELLDVVWPLEVALPVLPCRGGEEVLRALFEPLGWAVEVRGYALDEANPAWGRAPYLSVVLRGAHRISDALSQLYVLIPVLDDAKHYFVGEDEVAKLLRHGEGWLAAHPASETITARYLERRRPLVRMADEALVAEREDADGLAIDAEVDAEQDAEERQIEAPMSLHTRRLARVNELLRASSARTVVDLGCGEGKLLERLLKGARFDRVVGVDVSARSLEIAARRLRVGQMTPRQRERLGLIHGSVVYRDARLEGFDAAALVEVIEHVEPERLPALERAVFGHARPGMVVVTTPNAEYNALFPSLPAGTMRHRDHRFEWTRQEFCRWASSVAERFGYAVSVEPLGDEDETYGAPSQLAVFVREEEV